MKRKGAPAPKRAAPKAAPITSPAPWAEDVAAIMALEQAAAGSTAMGVGAQGRAYVSKVDQHYVSYAVL